MHEVITNNLDLWTSALLVKPSDGRGTNGKQEAYGIKKLRELILEFAVRGKLVPQDPRDEAASVLLAKSAKQRARLETEGRIRKQEDLPEIREDEKKFELPDGWEWVKLGQLMEMFNGRAFKSTEWGETGLPIIRIQNLNDPTATFNYFDGELAEQHLVQDGTFLISWSGTPGTSFGAFIWNRGKAALNQHINKCLVFLEDSNLQYLRLSVNSCMDHLISSAQGGVGLKHVTRGTLNNIVFGYPPLAEQHRIVAKVDELMALCDQLGRQQTHSIEAHQTLVETLLGTLTRAASPQEVTDAWTRIASYFDVLFTTEHSIEQLKQAILQLAVMGKLVPQDSHDEPARELLEKIAKEKARLVEDGKISKERHECEITEEQSSIALPAGWEVVRFSKIISLISGQHLKPEEYSIEKSDGLIPYLTGPAEFGEVFPVPTRYTKERRAIAEPGDVLITCKGSGVGKTNVADRQIAISRQLMSVRPIVVTTEFIKLLTDSFEEAIRENIVGIAIPGISREDVLNTIVYLPPLSEQHRILTKFNDLLALCDALKARLADVQTTQIDLADAIVEQAVA